MITLRHTATMPKRKPSTRPVPPADRALVTALLDATRHLTYEAWEQATGLSMETRYRWGNGNIRPLQPTTRYKVESYLTRHPSPKAPAAAAGLSGTARQQALRRLVALKAHVDKEIESILELIREE